MAVTCWLTSKLFLLVERPLPLKLSGDVHADPLPGTGTETPAPALALTMTGGENRPTSLLMVYLADL